MKKTIITSLVALCICAVASAVPIVIDFEDTGLASSDSLGNYAGFTWVVVDLVKQGHLGYYTQCATSGTYGASGYGAGDAVITRTNGDTFEFLGAWFSPANGNVPGYVDITGYLAGVQVGTTVTVTFTDATPIFGGDLSGNTIDELKFTNSATGHAMYYAFDDFTYIPEPATLVIFAIGGIGMVSRRKRA